MVFWYIGSSPEMACISTLWEPVFRGAKSMMSPNDPSIDQLQYFLSPPLYKKKHWFPKSRHFRNLRQQQKAHLQQIYDHQWPSNHNWCCDSMHFPIFPQSFQPPIALRDSKNCVAWTTTSMGFWHIWRSDWLDCCRICGAPFVHDVFFFVMTPWIVHIHETSGHLYLILLWCLVAIIIIFQQNRAHKLKHQSPQLLSILAGLQKCFLLNLHRSATKAIDFDDA